VTKLETAWLHPDVVTITPIDDEVGVNTFSNWISTLKPVWVPVIKMADTSCDALEATERVGISITEDLARMWGAVSAEELFESADSGSNPVSILESNQVAIKSSNLNPGSTVKAENSDANLVAPTF
jgi:hypothetical protein